jgi:hypothetical protein
MLVPSLAWSNDRFDINGGNKDRCLTVIVEAAKIALRLGGGRCWRRCWRSGWWRGWRGVAGPDCVASALVTFLPTASYLGAVLESADDTASSRIHHPSAWVQRFTQWTACRNGKYSLLQLSYVTMRL